MTPHLSRSVWGLALALTGCSTMHVPPPANLDAPLPPDAAAAGGMDVNVGAQTFYYYPLAFHLRGAKALPMGETPLALELGGNVGVGWVGINPALHWLPAPRPGSDWRFGGRLGLQAGAGDLLGEVPFADPFLGASLQGQASRVWDDGGAITAALGWGYTGHTRCMEGCSFDEPGSDPQDPGPAGHSYLPYNAPGLHLRADLPAGDGYAATLMLGAQPLISRGDVLPIFELGVGIHHHDPGPRW